MYIISYLLDSCRHITLYERHFWDRREVNVMSVVYGYTRISTKKQSIDRQVRNIKAFAPTAVIIQEVYTGTCYQGRKAFDKLIKIVKPQDTIIFDSVSRMSRNAEEGFEMYEYLYQKGIELIFLKERHIDTAVYREAIKGNVELTGTNADYIIEGINRYLLAIAKEQIRIAFDQAEKEVQDLRQRTKEGLETARLKGKQIGRKNGQKFITKKSIQSKEAILCYSRAFSGSLKDEDVIKLTGISRNTYYKYKRQLLEEEKMRVITHSE